MSDFDFNLFNELVENAPTVQFGPSVTFGKCTIEVNVSRWDNSEKKFHKTPFNGQAVDQTKESLEITFHIDIKEFNASLQNNYKRFVTVKKSGVKSDGTLNPKALTDWSQIVEPSLIAVLGKDWAKKLMKGVYVQVEEAETVVKDKSGNPKSTTTADGKVYVNTAPRFIAVYKSKAECLAAREERFGKQEDNEIGTDDEIPAKVIADFKGLVTALGYEVAVATVNERNLFPGYTAKQVAVAAGYEETE